MAEEKQQAGGKDPRRFRWEMIIMGAMYVGYAAFMLCRNTLIYSSAAMIRDSTLVFDVVIYGRLMSMHSAGAFAGKLILGVCADRIGGRAMFLLALLMTAVTTLLFGLVSGILLFALLNFVGQFFKSGGWPAMAKIIGDWYPRKRYGRTWSIISTSSRVGTISAGLLVGAVIVVWSWRGAFMVTGSIAVLVLILGWFFLKRRPADVGLTPPEEASESDEKRPPHPLDGTTLRQACLVFAKTPRVLLIFLSLALLTILMDFLIFIPPYLMETLNLEPGVAAMLGSIFPVGAFVALIACSIFYDRFSKRQLVFVLGGLLLVTCGCGGLLWAVPSMPASFHLPVAIGAIFVFGFAVSPAYYMPMSIFSISFGGKHSGFLIGLIDAFGYAGAFLFTFFGGSIAHAYGWPVFLKVLLGVAVCALLTMTAFLYLDHSAEKARS